MATTIKQFVRKYGLDLIVASHEDIALGDLVWDPIIGPPRFDHSMTKSLFAAFADAGYITPQNAVSMRGQQKAVDLVVGQLAHQDREIDVEVDAAADLVKAGVGDINAKFALKKSSRFTFGDIRVRVMSDQTRMELDDFLEQLKKNRWEAYDGQVRRLFVITELWYGSVDIVIESALAVEFDAAVAEAGIPVSAKIIVQGKTLYKFTNSTVPFAMQTVMVRRFNG